MKMNKLLLPLLLLAFAGCHCKCNFDTDKLLAELDKRHAELLVELDSRYAEWQLQWELHCQLEGPPTWWVMQQPIWWQWQPWGYLWPLPFHQWQQQPIWWQWLCLSGGGGTAL